MAQESSTVMGNQQAVSTTGSLQACTPAAVLPTTAVLRGAKGCLGPHLSAQRSGADGTECSCSAASSTSAESLAVKRTHSLPVSFTRSGNWAWVGRERQLSQDGGERANSKAPDCAERAMHISSMQRSTRPHPAHLAGGQLEGVARPGALLAAVAPRRGQLASNLDRRECAGAIQQQEANARHCTRVVVGGQAGGELRAGRQGDIMSWAGAGQHRCRTTKPDCSFRTACLYCMQQ